MNHSIGYYISQMLSYTPRSDKYFIRNSYNFSYISNSDSPPRYMTFEPKFYRGYFSLLRDIFNSDCILIGFYRKSSMLTFKLDNSVSVYFYYGTKTLNITTPNKPVRPVVLDNIEFYEEVYEAFNNKT